MRIASLFSLFIAALLSACLPVTSKVPAGSTVAFKPDPVLLGTWLARGTDKDSKEPAFLHFLTNEDGSMTALLVSPPEKKSEWGEYRILAATLGGNHVLNASEVSTNGKPSDSSLSKAYMLMLYRVDGQHRVLLYLMDEQAAAAAIKAGQIAGQVDPGQDGDVHITADAVSLDKFMASPQAAALFKKPFLTLTKLR